jgi:hypothetical protein
VINDVVRTDTAAVRVVGGGDQCLPEVAPRECGHVLAEHAPEVVEAPIADAAQRGGARRVGDVVEHSELVAGDRTGTGSIRRPHARAEIST